MDRRTDVVVVGGGQAGLATSFYLRRLGVEHVVLDASDRPGGAWQHTWPSLRLFSPAAYSSLPGWRMPPSGEENPDAAHVINYLTRYEQRYDVPVRRGVLVHEVRSVTSGFRVRTGEGSWSARAVVSATGTWSRPFVPAVPGQAGFQGVQLHSAQYAGPSTLRGARVVVVGGANSGAQIATDLLEHCEVTWCTLTPPRYLPDDVDGRELFRVASARVRGDTRGPSVRQLGDIVSVPPVRAARDAGRLVARPMVQRLTPSGVVWADGTAQDVDVVVWCTGFRPELRHLGEWGPGELRTAAGGDPVVDHVPGLVLIGYGDWCGAASATLIGVGQWARRAARSSASIVGVA